MKTLIKIGSSELIWHCWISIDIKSKEIIEYNISMERNLFVAEKFLSKNTEMNMANIRGINIDGGTCWYPPQVYQFLKLQHHTFIHILLMKKASLLKGLCNT